MVYSILDEMFPIIRFNRPFREVRAGSYEEVDGKGVLVLNALGVDEKDIQIEVRPSEYNNKQLLVVSGKTEVDESTYEFSYSYTIRPVKRVVPELKNGLLKVTLEYNKPTLPDVEIVGLLK